MAKKFELKERGTNEVVYPVTASNCVLHDGQQLDTIINNKAEITDLSNVIAENVMDDDTFEPVDQVTREDLKKDLFIDLWNNACGVYGKYNEETGYFELNGLTDITYEQALDIYIAGKYSNDIMSSYYGTKIRTHLPSFKYMSVFGIEYGFAFSDIEVVDMNLYIARKNCFKSCSRLHTIKVYAFVDDTSVLQNCKSLQNITVTNINNNLFFQDCPLITFKSLNHLKDKGSKITITVHQDIYNALIGNATYPFNGGTQEEWQQLLIDAAEKNITFSTI